MKLELGLKQAPVLTPQMIQSMEILQMNSQELAEYAAAAVQENPVLEPDDGSSGEDAVVYGEFSARFDAPRRNSDFAAEAAAGYVPDKASDFEESLFENLRSQLLSLSLERAQLNAALILAGSLNEKGWLDESLEDIAQGAGCCVRMLEEALPVLRSLEPAGVGARDLKECLLLQLERYYPDEKLAMEIVRNHLEAVSKLQYNSVAAKTGAEKPDISEACGIIRSLEPNPGRLFPGEERAEYIVPDVVVQQQGNRFEVRINQSFSTALGLNEYYSTLVKNSDDPEVRAYLAEKMKQAKWLVGAIEQRRRTLCRCVACLVRLQEDFFQNGTGHIVPMSLSDIAGELEMHESTVSRALKGKYLQCAMGVFPMSYFFSRSFRAADGVSSVSPDRVKALLRELIENEDKAKPLSDQKLCDRLGETGFAVSRRTVAKYRDEMNIPGASGRKNTYI